MEFRNLTPFSAMEYAQDNKEGIRFHVVAMKTAFQLEQGRDGQWQTVLLTTPVQPLNLEDTFSGAVNASSVLCESDLTFLKPACDVIVNGSAFTPKGVPMAHSFARVRLQSCSGEILLDKSVQVTGRRFYRRERLTGQWYESEPERFTSLKLDYRYAFGGECRIDADSKYAASIPESVRLSDEQRAGHPDTTHPPLAHAFCSYNPLGLGYSPSWFLHACDIHQVEAPRILSTENPFALKHFIDAQKENHWAVPEFRPAGFGIVGRTWLPRRSLAGTYDRAWLEHEHPALPKDFDFRYWNGAPLDQQIPYPTPGAGVCLSGFHADGDIAFTLPRGQAEILLRLNTGELIPQRMWIDTLHIDADARRVALTWRFMLPVAPDIRVIEARYAAEGV